MNRFLLLTIVLVLLVAMGSNSTTKERQKLTQLERITNKTSISDITPKKQIASAVERIKSAKIVRSDEVERIKGVKHNKFEITKDDVERIKGIRLAELERIVAETIYSKKLL